MGAYGSKQLMADLESLQRNDPTLVSLNYENSQLGDDAARELAKALVSNNVLRRLRLGGCNLTASGLYSICRSLCDNRVVPTRIRKLELSAVSEQSGVPVGNLLGNNGAKSLALLLAKCPSLHHLSVASCLIGDEGAVVLARALEGNSSLKTLDLSHNSISDVGVEQLGGALARNSSLRGLSLWSNRVFHSGAEALASGLTTNTTLQWLGLGCNHIGDEGVKALAIALLSNAQQSSLTWLGLGGNEITDRGVEHLAVALMAQRTQTEDTDGNEETSSQVSLTEQIRTGGLRPMLELGVTPSHVSIAVTEETHGQATPPTEEAQETIFCIPLESIGLGGNQITCAGATMLASGLKTNTRLYSLGLADNGIGDKGATALGDLLRYTDTLQKLVLSGNNIHDEGGSTLIAALSQNTSLTGLYLAGNPLSDAVGVRCEEVIGKHNHSLRVLDLHDTRLSTPALSSLVDVMQKQGVLKSLGCRGLPHSVLPPSQNMMEGVTKAPPPLLYRTGQRSLTTTVVPSQRHTTIEALDSLPPPDESAQTLVVKQASRSHTRRGSISQYIRRKLAKTGSSRGFRRQDSLEMSPTDYPRRQTRQSPPIELLPLTEEEITPALDDPLEMETAQGPNTSGSTTYSTPPHHPPPMSTSPHRPPLVSIHSTPHHPSPTSTHYPPPSPTHPEAVERIGGITKRGTMSPVSSPTRTLTGGKPLKEQWTTALRMRVGMLKMGGFLHSSFTSITNDESANEPPDYQAASLPCNQSKNRVSAPLPPGHSRVKLQLVLEEVGSDYINASYVGSPGHPKSYIVTQSPMVDSVSDLWRMVWEQRVCVIVVLTGEGEVEQWWPDEGETQTHPLVVGKAWAPGPLRVTMTSEQVTMSNPDVVVRKCDLVSVGDGEREGVTLYHYTAWMQRSSPASITDLADMYHSVLAARLEQAVSSPVLVVSALGRGRAGCFTAVAIAHELILSPDPNPLVWDTDQNILDQVIKGVRRCRVGLVETPQQYETCHLILDTIISQTKPAKNTGKKKKNSTSKKRSIFKKKSREKKTSTSQLPAEEQDIMGGGDTTFLF